VTVEELTGYSESQILGIDRIGPKRLEEIKAALGRLPGRWQFRAEAVS
jgi:hypothetical protein